MRGDVMTELTAIEQEVIITYNRKESFADVYSADPVTIRKLEKMAEKYPERYKLKRKDDISVTYEVPKKLIRFGAPNTKVYTEEEKDRLRKQLEKVRKK
jgi:hypothetical protein